MACSMRSCSIIGANVAERDHGWQNAEIFGSRLLACFGNLSWASALAADRCAGGSGAVVTWVGLLVGLAFSGLLFIKCSTLWLLAWDIHHSTLFVFLPLLRRRMTCQPGSSHLWSVSSEGTYIRTTGCFRHCLYCLYEDGQT